MVRVLVIEDEPTINMILDIALSEEGYQVITAPDGLTGLELMQRQPLPEIVLVDLLMPGISGKTVVKTMSSHAELRKIPVVIISGSLPSSENLPPKGSYQALISKPFDLTEVIDLVGSLTMAGRVA